MNRYQMNRQLGDGTYGCVLLGTAIATGEKVAIKKWVYLLDMYVLWLLCHMSKRTCVILTKIFSIFISWYWLGYFVWCYFILYNIESKYCPTCHVKMRSDGRKCLLPSSCLYIVKTNNIWSFYWTKRECVLYSLELLISTWMLRSISLKLCLSWTGSVWV